MRGVVLVIVVHLERVLVSDPGAGRERWSRAASGGKRFDLLELRVVDHEEPIRSLEGARPG